MKCIDSIVGDTHVHTIMSGHAHSTLLENIAAAKSKGHRFVFVTDHTGVLGMCPDREAYFLCMNSTIPEMYDGIHIIRGCEVNIVGCSGELDLPDGMLKEREWVIASLHGYIFSPISYEKTTQIWLNVAKNPDVDVIGHCGEEQWKFDYEKGIEAFKENNKIVEINSASIRNKSGCASNCREIALLCKRYEVPIVISSDAHFAPLIGDVSEAVRMLEEIAFPERLIINADYARMADVLHRITGRCF